MKAKDINKLRGDIREYMKHRKKIALMPQHPSRLRIFISRISPLLMIAFIAFAIYAGAKPDTTQEGIVFLWAINFTLLVGILGDRHQLSAPPIDKDKIDEWIWKRNLKSGIYFFLLLMGLTFIYSAIYTNPITQYVLIVDLAILGVVGVCLLLVLVNPSFFLNPIINSIGTTAIFAFSILYILRLMLTYQFFWAFVGISFLIPFLISWRMIRNKQELTLFQTVVLQSIDTNRLFNALRTHSEKLRDESRALAVWLKLENNFSHGEKEEFLRILAPIYNNKRKSYKTIINVFSWLLLAIVALIIEDFFYTPVIKPILCQSDFLQNWIDICK